MARDYGKVASTFWTGETGRAIRAFGGDAQRVALYLMTCPMSSMIGLYYLPLPILCHEVGITPQGATKALASLSEAGFAQWDAASEVVFVKEMAAWQVGEPLEPKDNRVKGVEKEWQAMRKCPFYKPFHKRYAKSFHLPEPVEAQATCKPLRSQEQEQEQKQEQEQDQELPPAKGVASVYPASFNEFWSAYPRRIGKQKAFNAWKAAGKRVMVERSCDKHFAAAHILEAAKAFAASAVGRSQFCPHPTSWLNAGQYDDDRTAWNRTEEPKAQRSIPQLPE